MGVPIVIFLLFSIFRRKRLFVHDAVRAVPVLVLLFLAYYFPYIEIIGIAPPSAVFAAIIAMSISQAAYTADIVRAAIDGVSKGPVLAGKALGLKDRHIWCHIIIPDIFRQILPAQVAFFIGIVRLSSLASVIGASEVVYVARVAIAQNFRSLEAWLLVALIYIALVLPLTWLSRKLETSEWLKRRV